MLKKLGSKTAPGGLSPWQRKQATEPADLSTQSQEIANMSRMHAGVGPGQPGFTCARCLIWFPAGTSHACRPFADVVRGDKTPMPESRGMTQAELDLLHAAGQ